MFHRTVLAIADALLSERGDDSPAARRLAAEFVSDQHARMPDYLRLPLAVLAGLFQIWPVFFFYPPFSRLSRPDRRCFIQAWKSSRLGFRRDLMKFMESLIVFAWASKRKAA